MDSHDPDHHAKMATSTIDGSSRRKDNLPVKVDRERATVNSGVGMMTSESGIGLNCSKASPYMNSDTTNSPVGDAIEPANFPANLNDEELLLEYRDSGDRRCFEELVHRYERELFNYLRRYLGNVEMAEDVFQATFLQLHLKCQQYEKGRSVRPWLYTIATNQAIDAQRRNKRHRAISLDRVSTRNTDEDLGRLVDLLTSNDIDPTDTIGTLEDISWVQTAFAELPEPMRQALNLVYYQGLKYREAAEILAVPVGTVKSRVHGAILKLIEQWRNSHPKAD